MSTKTELEYLSGPLIEGAVFTITEDYVDIRSAHTIYASARRETPLCKDELMALYKEVLRSAKTKGVKVSNKLHVRKFIAERWNEYEKRSAEVDALFGKIVEQAKVVQARGLHSGTRDDLELAKLYDVCDEFRKLFLGSILSQIPDIKLRLSSFRKELASPHCELCRIYL